MRFRALLVVPLALLTLVACGEPDPEELTELTQALQTFPNQEPAFYFFVEKGLTPAQSAGIVGNLSAESGVDPAIQQIGGGPGRGLAQWQVGGRWDTSPNDNVLDYAEQRGASPISLQLQLDFIWYELTTFPSYGLEELQATTTARAAAISFMTDFEGCGSCSTAKRIEYAEDVLARFGSGGGSSSSGGSADACVLDTGETGECMSTEACALLEGHVSTPGFCPGATNIQCCTDPGGGSSGAQPPGQSSGASRPQQPGNDNDDGDGDDDVGRIGRLDGSDSGGCSASGRSASALWLVGAALLLGRRWRRHRAGLSRSARAR